MAAIQTLLFPDPRPLLETLGQEFFRQAPERPGVYLMRDAAQTVLYVGKAKNLRRLGSYRVANPDRLPRRHLRMLRAVARIDLEECLDEQSALARESELLLKLRPRFNRAGTWPAPPRFLVWRQTVEHLELAITEEPEAGWEAFGPLRSVARSLRNAVARLIWCALYPELGPARMPLGWIHGQFQGVTCLGSENCASGAALWLRRLCSGEAETFIEWVRAQIRPRERAFEKAAIESDLELLSDIFLATAERQPRSLLSDESAAATPTVS